MSYVKENDVAYAKTQLGVHETGNNCQQYSEEQYGVRCPGGGWCMSFASRCAREGGFVFDGSATYGPKGFSYTGAAITWAQQHGLWREKHWRAQPGDWVIFDWNGDGNTDHVETVVYDDGAQIITIGGNTGNQVMYRKRDRSFVNCIIALSASPQAKPILTPAVIAGIKKLLKWEAAVTKTPLELGDSGPNVTTLNQLLADRGLMASTKYMNIYTKGTRDAVVHLKRLLHLPNDVGTRFGGDAAKAILAPH